MFATPNIRNSNSKRSHSPRERISLPDRLSHSSRLSWAWCWILCYQWRCRTRLRRHARRRGGGRCHEWAKTCSLSLSGHCHARVTRTEWFVFGHFVHQTFSKTSEISVFETLKISKTNTRHKCFPFHCMTAKANCIFSPSQTLQAILKQSFSSCA